MPKYDHGECIFKYRRNGLGLTHTRLKHFSRCQLQPILQSLRGHAHRPFPPDTLPVITHPEYTSGIGCGSVWERALASSLMQRSRLSGSTLKNPFWIAPRDRDLHTQSD